MLVDDFDIHHPAPIELLIWKGWLATVISTDRPDLAFQLQVVITAVVQSFGTLTRMGSFSPLL